MIYSQDETLGASEGTKNRKHNTLQFILNCVQQPMTVFALEALNFPRLLETDVPHL